MHRRLNSLVAACLLLSSGAACTSSKTAAGRCRAALEASAPTLDEVRSQCAPLFRHANARVTWTNLDQLAPSSRYEVLVISMAQDYCPTFDPPAPELCRETLPDIPWRERAQLDREWEPILKRILEREIPSREVPATVKAFQTGLGRLFPPDQHRPQPAEAPPVAVAERAPPVTVAEPTVLGGLEMKVVADVTQKQAGELATCRTADWPGKSAASLLTRYVISAQGDVAFASIQEASPKPPPDVEQCLLRTLKRWHFPSPREGGVVIVTQRFEIAAR